MIKEKANRLNEEEKELFLKLWGSADTIRESRFNFFLLGQSIFIIAAFTSTLSSILYRLLVSILALVFTIAMWINIRRISQRLDWVIEKKLFGIKDFEEFIKKPTGLPGKIFGRDIMTIILPIAIIIFWIAFMVMIFIFP